MMGDIFIVCMGVVCFFMGCGCRKKKAEPCDTLEDILNREG